MPHRAAPRLGDLERVVMERLWADESRHGLSVREVFEPLAEERDLAYTTVMTVLDRLAKKELVTRERDGRAWRYLPAGSRESLTADTMRETLGSADDRRAALLHFLGGASSDEIADLKAALAEVEARGAREH